MVVTIVDGSVNWYNVSVEQFINHGRLCQCTYNAATRTVASGYLCMHTHTSTQGTEPRARCRRGSAEERTRRNPCRRDTQSEGQKEGTQMCFVRCIHRLQKWSPIFKNEEISHTKCRFLISLRENEAGGLATLDLHLHVVTPSEDGRSLQRQPGSTLPMGASLPTGLTNTTLETTEKLCLFKLSGFFLGDNHEWWAPQHVTAGQHCYSARLLLTSLYYWVCVTGLHTRVQRPLQRKSQD